MRDREQTRGSCLVILVFAPDIWKDRGREARWWDVMCYCYEGEVERSSQKALYAKTRRTYSTTSRDEMSTKHVDYKTTKVFFLNPIFTHSGSYRIMPSRTPKPCIQPQIPEISIHLTKNSFSSPITTSQKQPQNTNHNPTPHQKQHIQSNLLRLPCSLILLAQSRNRQLGLPPPKLTNMLSRCT